MKKEVIFLLSLLIYLGIISACSNLDGTTEVLGENEEGLTIENLNFEDAEVEYVDLESLPEWLISWISSIEEKNGREKTVFREGDEEGGDNPQLFRGVCEGSVFYFIYNHANSCIFCDTYFEDGKQLDFHDEDFVQAFEHATHNMKRIYIK